MRVAVFFRQAVAVVMLAWAHTAAQAVLKPGQLAPLFTIQAARAGEVFEFDLSQALSRGPVVLYFYPKAFTSGCTYEANLFAQASDRFAALGATVIGVSNDDIQTLQRFSIEACRNKFAVGADESARVIRAYQAQIAARSQMADRISYVISPEGRIVHVHHDPNPEGHVATSLQAVERLRSSWPQRR